ncbi:MAG: hypothetical protein KAX69_03625 [Chitinophagales bacterium]|nr:hypothetical protein [Chitinophagales bacterium]MCC6584251.1 hypothetical protein [Chitinophagales bacterium]
MKALNVLVVLFLITVFTIPVNSFAKSKSDSKLFDREAWIPADFNPEKIVLLIDNIPDANANKAGIKMYEKESKWMEEIMQKYYPYPYEFVTTESLEKYSDKSKYPYMLSWGSHFHEYMNQSAHLVSGTSGWKISIIDLKTGVESKTNEWSFSYKKGTLEATIKQLVKVIKERKK